ncbi:MAG: hypothetical protein AAB266_05585 [Nitrospirota bacterium]
MQKKAQAEDIRLERVARDSGAILFGVGDVSDLKESFNNLSEKTCHGLDIGISIGVKVSTRILEDIDDHPTRLYMHHYKSINILIDQIALKLSSIIEEEGFDAIPIPASQIVDWEKQTAHLSHKMIAVRAGLGWIGRSNLIINPRYGAAVRYGSILTNMPLTVHHPVEDGCRDCYKCLDVCPASAIKESYRDYDMISCMNKLKWFQKNYNTQHYICGICVKICKGRGYGTDQDA